MQIYSQTNRAGHLVTVGLWGLRTLPDKKLINFQFKMRINKSLRLSPACSPATLTIGCDRCSATNCARLIWHHKLARFLLADNVPLTRCSVVPASSVSRGLPTRSCHKDVPEFNEIFHFISVS